jgi:DNA-binding Xre family transcriptional regulator
MVGLPVEVISGLEKGQKDVTLMRLNDIATALDCGIYDLIPNIQTVRRVMADEVDRHSKEVYS